MKKILFLGLIAFSQLLYAQFFEEDVKFYVGEGESTAFMIVDFRDGTDDRSYAWGFRFDEEDDLTVADMLMAIEQAEPNFYIQTSYNGAFLSDIVFNSHSGLGGDPDWWSTWSGEGSDNMNTSGGISESLTDGRWYGTSYGFSPSPEHPHQPLPAYHSLWFSSDDIINWFGQGDHQSIIVVDFGTETEGSYDSFAFGIKYEDETISAADALEILMNQVSTFSYEITDGDLTYLSWGDFEGVVSETNPWKSYIGTDLSNWVTAADFENIVLNTNEWLGLSFGERRPITPTDQSEQLNVKEVLNSKISIYPNPSNDVFYIDASALSNVEIYDLNGRKLKAFKDVSSNRAISVKDLNKGIYLVKIQSGETFEVKKLIVK